MAAYSKEFDGQIYDEPRDELRARALRASGVGDEYVAVPVELAILASHPRQQCTAITVVNLNRMEKTMVQLRCEKDVDPKTGRHQGQHVNGRDVW